MTVKLWVHFDIERNVTLMIWTGIIIYVLWLQLNDVLEITPPLFSVVFERINFFQFFIPTAFALLWLYIFSVLLGFSSYAQLVIDAYAKHGVLWY